MSTIISARPSSSSGLLAGLTAALLAAGARADVLHVPGDFPTVAAALAAAQPGDEVVLAAGSYNDSVLLDGVNGVTLRGQGQVTLGGGDALTAALRLTNCLDVTIERLAVANPEGIAVLVDDSDNITLSRVRVQAAGTDGIVVADESEDVLLDRCRVDGAGVHGIVFEEVAGCTALRCIVSGVGGHGIEVDDAFTCRVERCRFSGTGLIGIRLISATGCVAIDNVVLDAGTDGLGVSGPDNVVLRNRVKVAGEEGVHLTGATTTGLVQDNRLLDCGTGLLSVGAGALLRGNRIVGSEVLGLHVTDGACVVTDNLVVKSAGTGYLFDDTQDGGAIFGNRARQAGGHGFEIGVSGISITGNSSVGAGIIGFEITGADNVLIGNSAHGSVLLDLENLGAQNIYLDNDFGTSNLGDPP